MTTSLDMYRYFLYLLKKENQGTVTPAVANTLLNAAQINYISARLEMVEKDQRIRDTFRILIPPPVVIPNTGTNAPEQEVFVLPYVSSPGAGVSRGYWRMLNVAFDVRLPSGDPAPCADAQGWTVARPLTRDQRFAAQQNPFTKPIDEEPYYILTEDSVRAWTGTTSYVDRARIEYLRYPVEIDVDQGAPIDPELPSHINQEIVHTALRTHLEVIQSQRYQTNVTERTMNP